MEIDQFVHLNKLYSTYRELLTEKQNRILDYYLCEDWSLGEISDEMGISRQAVHDAIKRSQQILMDYEKKLEVIVKEEKVYQYMEDIISILSQSDRLQKEDKDKIIQLCKELIE